MPPVTFEKINAGGARDETGVVVQIAGPEVMQYRSGDRIASITLDFDPRSRVITVRASEVKTWDTPANGSLISAIEREQIAQDLKLATLLLEGKFLVL